MKPWINYDERSEAISGKVAFVFLVLTQAGLLISIFLQRYIWLRPPAYYNLAAIILGLSTGGFWIVNLLVGGLLPDLSRRTLTLSYFFLVLSIAIPYTLIRGFPHGQEWLRWSLVMLGGPAIMVGGYALAAALGRRRLDQLASK